jgi:hypothetical protein
MAHLHRFVWCIRTDPHGHGCTKLLHEAFAHRSDNAQRPDTRSPTAQRRQEST